MAIDAAVEMTEEIAARHGLSAEEYARIVGHLGRAPNITELGIFSVMWSEHCSYKSSRVHLRRFPTTGPRVIQGPGENAGAVDIGGGLAAVFKMESHNHPSFIEPYQGAATGVGGILRDVFTMGARPIASLDSLRFGPLTDPRHRTLLEGVVAGISGYGNCVGVPTVGGELSCHPSFAGNILVNVFTLGIAKSDRLFRGTASGVGNPVIYVGSRTGRDGIHGATMASAEFDDESDQKRPTVQVGDPFTEKLLLEACLELMSKDMIVGIQDMGAAGLTSSSCEMAGRAGTGIELWLDKVPRREPGMTPYELMLSESQERMLIVAKAGRESGVMEMFEKWDLPVAVVGRVTGSGTLRVMDGGRLAAEIPVQALTDDAPVYNRPIERPRDQDERNRFDPSALPQPDDYGRVLRTLLAVPGIAHKGWVVRQYDHMVRTNTVVRPGSDAAVIRIKGTAKGLALSVDCNSRYCFLDPRLGGALAVAEAARNISCSGATPLAVTDCLNFGSPERPETMWQFSEAVDGISEACAALGTPVVSGNVSFYNETNGAGIYPTPMIAMVGLLEDVNKRAQQGFTKEGDAILLLGETPGRLGGSEYLASIHGLETGAPPSLDLDLEKRVQAACREAIQEGLASAAHDASDGGLAVALAESCLSGPRPIGALVDLPNPGGSRADEVLFGEAASRIILSVPEGRVADVEAVARRNEAPIARIGTVGGEKLEIAVGGRGLVSEDVAGLNGAWRNALALQLGVSG
ncbi:MAG: phosphoribosylformylglycinamidine synthase II [Nitrospirae bacterium RBG_16_64_22]|nr:MAG: phosphoribosylformylglycinamidine synthase II [Nitrospirae bacterium RBG_16_64_22]